MLIKNAHIINEGREIQGDVLIEKGRIAKIGPGLTAGAEIQVFDAGGGWLLPGMIDDQVHFRDPGLTHKGDLATESAAAVAGGITSFFEMPNTIPNATRREVLAQKYERAAGRAHGNYAFWFGAANDNLDEIRRLQPNEACGVKVFMGASTGNMLVDNPETLDGIFKHCPLIIATHCEDTPTIQANEAQWKAQYGDDVPVAAHPEIRSAEACYKSTELAVSLARRHNARLHVLHLSTARELEFFPPGPLAGKRITGEACVHHLYMDQSLYEERGNRIKCNPAIKSAHDRIALVQAVHDGRLDIIATDHAPHTAEEKARPYLQAPAGLPLVQHALLMLLDLVQRGELNVGIVVERTSHAVAERFGIVDRGYIREGYWADLVLVDPHRPTLVRADDLLYKCGWSPLEGQRFPHAIAATWVNGELAWDGQRVHAPAGQRLAFKQDF